jgi:hypothetical protein
MSIISKKLTENELTEIKEIRQQYSELALSLGELELQKRKLLDLYNVLQDREIKLASHLQEKYGEGNIDLETGEIKS